MATLERSPSVEELISTEVAVITWRLAEHYSRAPERRREARIDMTWADDLQRRRPVMTLTEFSVHWVGRDGAQP